MEFTRINIHKFSNLVQYILPLYGRVAVKVIVGILLGGDQESKGLA